MLWSATGARAWLGPWAKAIALAMRDSLGRAMAMARAGAGAGAMAMGSAGAFGKKLILLKRSNKILLLWLS